MIHNATRILSPQIIKWRHLSRPGRKKYTQFCLENFGNEKKPRRGWDNSNDTSCEGVNWIELANNTVYLFREDNETMK